MLENENFFEKCIAKIFKIVYICVVKLFGETRKV